MENVTMCTVAASGRHGHRPRAGGFCLGATMLNASGQANFTDQFQQANSTQHAKTLHILAESTTFPGPSK